MHRDPRAPSVPATPRTTPSPRIDGHRAAAHFVSVLHELTHALRGPAAAMQTAAELLRGAHAHDPEDLVSLVEVFERESARVAALLERGRALQGLGALRSAPVDLARLGADAVTRACAQLVATPTRSPAPAPRVTFHVTHAPSSAPGSPSEAVLYALGDRDALGAALDALLDNARAALDEASAAISVTLERDAERELVSLRVCDDGRGLTESARRNAFRLFYSTRPEAEGVGLTLARLTAVAHGGEVTLKPRAPRGVEATLTLPRWRPCEAEAYEQQPDGEGA